MEYPDRVTRGEDGVYRWTVKADKKYMQNDLRVVLAVAGVLFTAVIGYITYVSDAYDVRQTCLGILIIMFIIQMIYMVVERIPGSITQHYALSSKNLTIEDKGKTVIPLDKVEKVYVYGDALELFGKLGSPMVFVPYEDYEIVSTVILQSIPEKAAVERR